MHFVLYVVQKYGPKQKRIISDRPSRPATSSSDQMMRQTSEPLKWFSPVTCTVDIFHFLFEILKLTGRVIQSLPVPLFIINYALNKFQDWYAFRQIEYRRPSVEDGGAYQL